MWVLVVRICPHSGTRNVFSARHHRTGDADGKIEGPEACSKATTTAEGVEGYDVGPELSSYCRRSRNQNSRCRRWFFHI